MCVETGGNKVWDDDYDSSCDDSCISQILELTDLYDTPLQKGQGSKSERVHDILYGLQEGQHSAIVTSGTAYAPERDVNAIVGYNVGIQESSANSLYTLGNPGKLQTGAGIFGIQETSAGVFYNFENSGKLQTGTGTFGIQETSQGIFYNGANPEGSKTGTMAYGGKFNEKVDPTADASNPHYMGTYKCDNGMPPLTDVVRQTNNFVSVTKPCKSNTINAWATEEGNLSEIEEARRAVQGFQGLCPPPEKKFRRE